MRRNLKRSIFKNHRNCLPLGPGVRSRQKSVRRLRNPPLELNVLIRLPPWSSLGEQFLRKIDTRKFCVFQIFLLRSIKPFLCPNIINFDSVDFSEHRPEEVISFFWRSVYYSIDGFEWIFINLLKNAAFSFQTTTSNLLFFFFCEKAEWGFAIY